VPVVSTSRTDLVGHTLFIRHSAQYSRVLEGVQVVVLVEVPWRFQVVRVTGEFSMQSLLSARCNTPTAPWERIQEDLSDCLQLITISVGSSLHTDWYPDGVWWHMPTHWTR